MERKDNSSDVKSVKSVSPIPEDVEVTNEEETVVPVGSQYGERAVSANPRGRSAMLRARRSAIEGESKSLYCRILHALLCMYKMVCY